MMRKEYEIDKLNPRKNKYAGMLKQQIRKESQAKQKSMIL